MVMEDASLLDALGGLLWGAVNITEDADATIELLAGSVICDPGPKPGCGICWGLSPTLSVGVPTLGKAGRVRLSIFWSDGDVPVNGKNSCSVVGPGPRWLNRSYPSRTGPWIYDCGWGG